MGINGGRVSRQLVSLLLMGLVLLGSRMAKADISYNTNTTAAQITGVLDGPGLSVNNLSVIKGVPGQYGIFTNGTSILGVETGLFMDTGNVSSLQGPNNQTAFSINNKVTYLDSNLSSISTSAKYDPAIIEFDIVPQGDRVNFVFVFGSDEYPEYVCSRFNDAFGLFVAGPGLNGVKNAAFMPGSGDAIAVNNVNDGTKGPQADGTSCNLGNSAYFIDNGNGTGNAATQLDGYTKPITASLGGLIAGQSYHIKLALADAGDPGYDSGALFKWLTSTKSEPVDLSLQLSASSLTPLKNGEVDIIYTLTNSSAVATSLVQVGIELPAGVTWLADDSNGAYDPAKGSWNADTIGANASKSLKIRAKVGADASYNLNGEIIFAFNEDPDSKPFNRSINPNEDDTASLTLNPGDKPSNQPPVITSNSGGATALLYVNEGKTTVTTMIATDPEGSPLVYSISGGKDASKFRIDANTGILSFMTAPDYEKPEDFDANNAYDVQVMVSDGVMSDTQGLTVSVLDVKENVAPIITSDGGGDTATVSVKENLQAVTIVAANDANQDTLTYSITGGADRALFRINATTGRLSFVTAPDYEKPINANNTYEVQVTVNDGALKDSQLITVKVLDVVEGSPPVIISNGGAADVILKIPEDQTALPTVEATDPDNDIVTFRLSTENDGSLFQINTNTGKLAFIKPPDFENPLDSNRDNVYLVTVVAMDGVYETTQLLYVSVLDGQENVAPVITSNGGQSLASVNAAENQTTVTTVTATDANKDTITYSITGGADAGLFQISMDGLLHFVTAPDFENPVDTNKDNVYEVKVMASDGKLSAQQTLNVIVTDVFENIAPVLTSHEGKSKVSLSVTENDTLVTVVSASDANPTDKLVYSISGGADASQFTIDSKTGALRFINAPDFENPLDTNKDNIYDVVVSVTDGTATVTQAFTVSIQDIEDVPYVTLSVKAILQGAYNSSTKLMNNNLAVQKYVPTLQPYGDLKTAFGYTDSGGVLSPFNYHGTETASNAVYNATGNDALVDWVLVELRDSLEPSKRLGAMAGVLQRDGDVVDAATGSTTLRLMNVNAGNYFIMVRHRNHLAIMTSKPQATGHTPVIVNFTDPATPVYGGDWARTYTGDNKAMMWCGDTNNSNTAIANGPGSDSSVILGAILVHPENYLVNTGYRLMGYYASDLNMDGVTIFTGPGNDVNVLLGNILMYPGNTYLASNYILHGLAPH